MNTESVDSYLQDGCGRCDKFQTPDCKVHLWTRPLVALRELVLRAGLAEEMKWGSPTYTLDRNNVLMIVSLKKYCALQFFKGALFEDPEKLLESAGPNSRHVRSLRFRSMTDVTARKAAARQFIEQAMELERQGKKVAPLSSPEPMPAELERRLAADAALRKAYQALTPGRQRSHILHVSGAKQAETRERRVDKCAEAILAGRGFNER